MQGSRQEPAQTLSGGSSAELLRAALPGRKPVASCVFTLSSETSRCCRASQEVAQPTFAPPLSRLQRRHKETAWCGQYYLLSPGLNDKEVSSCYELRDQKQKHNIIFLYI